MLGFVTPPDVSKSFKVPPNRGRKVDVPKDRKTCRAHRSLGSPLQRSPGHRDCRTASGKSGRWRQGSKSPKRAVAHAGRRSERGCRFGPPHFVEKVEGGRRGPREGGDMTEYLIAFNDEWVPELTDEDVREASKRVRALRAEMEAAGVLIFTGGLDDAAPVFSVDASS